MFDDLELVFTRDSNNQYMGGGYVLKSEFMECGAPPIINVKNKNADNVTDGKKKKTVSSLLFGGTRAVPAGLFLMNRRQSNDAQPLSSLYDDSRINSVLGGGGSSDESSDSDSSGDSSGSNSSHKSGGKNRNAVVPETLYDTLFKMLSPDADKWQYWGNGAKTQRRQQQKTKKNDTRKQNKK
jgi:hypothetical protein